MKICFSSFAYTAYPLHIAIHDVAEIGYDGVEITAIRPHALPEDLTKRDRKKIEQLITSLDLEVSAVVQPTFFNMISPIKKERAEAIQYLKDCIRLASELEAENVVTVPGTKILPNFGVSYKKAFQWARNGIEEGTELAEDEGIILALEPLSRLRGSVNFMYRIDEVIELIKQINSKCLGITLDVEHRSNENEDLIGSLKKIGDLPTYIHIRDTDGTIDQKIPGKGRIDFDAFLRSLINRSYKGFLTIEFWNLDEPKKFALESLVSIKRMLASIS